MYIYIYICICIHTNAYGANPNIRFQVGLWCMEAIDGTNLVYGV